MRPERVLVRFGSQHFHVVIQQGADQGVVAGFRAVSVKPGPVSQVAGDGASFDGNGKHLAGFNVQDELGVRDIGTRGLDPEVLEYHHQDQGDDYPQ